MQLEFKRTLTLSRAVDDKTVIVICRGDGGQLGHWSQQFGLKIVLELDPDETKQLCAACAQMSVGDGDA